MKVFTSPLLLLALTSLAQFSLLAQVVPVLETESATQKALPAIQRIGPEGEGNEEAVAAWKVLVAQPVGDLPLILRGMNGLHAVAKNYLYTAARAIADRPATALPRTALEDFLLDMGQDASARKLCYDMLLKKDVSVKERLLPKLLQDPCAPLRREAVERLTILAKLAASEGKKPEAIAHYQEALKGAIEEEQVKSIADELKALGQEVNLLQHFGFITDWSILGPFHNKARAGFAEAFATEPPTAVDLQTSHTGLDGPVKWKQIKVADPMGLVLFNKELAEKKEVTAFAFTEFVSDKNRPAQIRLGSKNAWKVWFNGILIFERDEYHRGRRIDQYILPIQMRPGPNQLLVKCCQNEELQTWTGEWQFQLRITDLNGDALKSAVN